MTTVTLKIDSTENAELLIKILSSMDFVKEIETLDEETELTAEHVAELEARLASLESGETTFKTWDEVRESIRKKHGF